MSDELICTASNPGIILGLFMVGPDPPAATTHDGTRSSYDYQYSLPLTRVVTQDDIPMYSLGLDVFHSYSSD